MKTLKPQIIDFSHLGEEKKIIFFSANLSFIPDQRVQYNQIRNLCCTLFWLHVCTVGGSGNAVPVFTKSLVQRDRNCIGMVKVLTANMLKCADLGCKLGFISSTITVTANTCS